MSILGDAKGLIELIRSGWTWARDKRDPIRLQAGRLIRAFEAHGIARQQIPRLLPSNVVVPAASFASADKLRDCVTPQLLDWASNFLALNRPWLDGVATHPHRLIEHYKQEQGYGTWFQAQHMLNPEASRFLYVCAESDPTQVHGTRGFITLLYEEMEPGLDGNEFSRYWRLSSEWPIHHGACVVSMLEVSRLASEAGILVLGRVVPRAVIVGLEQGSVFAGEATSKSKGNWHPDDMRQLLLVG